MTKHSICLDTDANRLKAKHWIDLAPSGWFVSLEEENRSLVQNAKFHAMISDIAKHYKWEWAGAKRNLVCWKRILVNQFYAEIGVHSEILPSLDFKRVVIINDTTSDMNKTRAAEFVEYLYALGAELRIVWSEPALQAYEDLRRGA